MLNLTMRWGQDVGAVLITIRVNHPLARLLHQVNGMPLDLEIWSLLQELFHLAGETAAEECVLGDHAHITRMLDAGLSEAGQPYLVMEWSTASTRMRIATVFAITWWSAIGRSAISRHIPAERLQRKASKVDEAGRVLAISLRTAYRCDRSP